MKRCSLKATASGHRLRRIQWLLSARVVGVNVLHVEREILVIVILNGLVDDWVHLSVMFLGGEVAWVRNSLLDLWKQICLIKHGRQAQLRCLPWREIFTKIVSVGKLTGILHVISSFSWRHRFGPIVAKVGHLAGHIGFALVILGITIYDLLILCPIIFETLVLLHEEVVLVILSCLI